MRQTVCVTGASGGIGQALLERLIEVYDVKALFRAASPSSDEWERRGCTIVRGDLADDAALAQLVTGARFVFHCAALVGKGSSRDAHAINVTGTRRLADVAARHGCERFVHVSSAAVYSGAPVGGERVEDTPLRDRDDLPVYALTKLRAELALRGVAGEHGLQYTIVRPSCVYGPKTKSYTLVPVELIRKGLPVMLGDGHGLLDVVYADDVARALVLAAESPRAGGETFNIGHETVTFGAFYAHYAGMLGRPARHLPLPIARGLLRLLRTGREGHRGPRGQLASGLAFLIDSAVNTARYPSAKARTMMGYAPQWTLATAMVETELWLREQGLAPRRSYALPGYGPLPFRPQVVARPETEEDLSRIVRIAGRRGMCVRAIGALHSLCPIPETNGICIVLDRYRELLKVDGALVTVEAGMTLRELHRRLAGLGLALPINGSIAAQTVAGAISTATHGGSLHYGALSDYVESVRLVRADGRVVEVGRRHEAWGAAAASLGLLGVVSSVTLRCVPPFSLQSRSDVRPAQEVFESFDEIQRDHRYVDMLYFPIVDQVEVLCIDPVEEARAAAGSPAQPAREVLPAGRRTVRAGLQVLGLRAIARLVHHLGLTGVQRGLARRWAGSAYPQRMGRSDLVLAFGDQESASRSPMILRDMEVAVPYEHARRALSALRQHFAERRTYPLLPVHVRCSPRSEVWLSPAHERDVCWIELWQYPSSDTLFDEVHQLLQPFGYRFHWGKETQADAAYIRAQYGRWDDFAHLRGEWDPTGMFLNGYLESFFARRATPSAGVPARAASGARV
jgi:nucleoside-diphosphate-sugar epimerase/FAD/FMN-containing dehydrogenase